MHNSVWQCLFLLPSPEGRWDDDDDDDDVDDDDDDDDVMMMKIKQVL